MAERVHPSAKPNGTTAAATSTAAAANGTSTFPAAKSQFYRPAYRPQPPPRRSYRRSCWCRCCLCTTLIVLFLLLLIGIAGIVLYVLYRPHRPDFSVSNFQISQFNLSSSSSQLNTSFNLTISAYNPNKKIVFFYNPISVSVFADGISVGNGNFPAFTHSSKNTTILRSVISSQGQSLDSTAASTLKSDLKTKNGLPLKIQLETKVKVKMGAVKTKRVGIRVTCDGIHGSAPTGKSPATASKDNAKCSVDLRVKIWKWTF
ncbi:Late embryogenesis abundant protein, LEA_2 subgroup [Dillenia turbinata]|uniref:Late embryogenesis abundant protein, LEA_2 subgroup n=1 Tax=Dillenia turbinata TaxID=194707 RepID=A0AAN8UAP3_9MAGN